MMWWNTLLRVATGPARSKPATRPEDKQYKYAFQPEYVRQYPPDLADVKADPRWAQTRPAIRYTGWTRREDEQ